MNFANLHQSSYPPLVFRVSPLAFHLFSTASDTQPHCLLQLPSNDWQISLLTGIPFSYEHPLRSFISPISSVFCNCYLIASGLQRGSPDFIITKLWGTFWTTFFFWTSLLDVSLCHGTLPTEPHLQLFTLTLWILSLTLDLSSSCSLPSPLEPQPKPMYTNDIHIISPELLFYVQTQLTPVYPPFHL